MKKMLWFPRFALLDAWIIRYISKVRICSEKNICWPGHQRVLCLIWKIAKGGLLTNGYRKRSHMTDSALCPLCGIEEENTMHILRDCVCGVKGVWISSVHGGPRGNFFSASLKQWLHTNLQMRNDAWKGAGKRMEPLVWVIY